ncbi:class I SAM-dependent methyltransferase [Ningiella sp. W23]|uniref:class I SAM-dependent methyltransferase n=1 Tax=Ningiella sp. W23 TaxID=3023715 RepID=UPI0037567EA1
MLTIKTLSKRLSGVSKSSFALSMFAIASLSLTSTSAISSAHAHDGNQALAAVVLDRDADKRARDASRRPVQTLSFFHVEPGMRVAEALPGGGWYSEILANYLGSDGALYGINYNESMWPLFGFFTPERIEEMSASTAAFPGLVAELTDNGITAGGFTFAGKPEELNGTLDRVLFIRALHNLARFEEQAGTLSESLKVAHDLLKDEGLVGVVQHRAPSDADDDWAKGGAGYLKQAFVISAFEEAGFELVAQSEINANEKDKPSDNDIVWRLPPSLNGSADDPAKRAEYEAIGESDRMTLLFAKKGFADKAMSH